MNILICGGLRGGCSPRAEWGLPRGSGMKGPNTSSPGTEESLEGARVADMVEVMTVVDREAEIEHYREALREIVVAGAGIAPISTMRSIAEHALDSDRPAPVHRGGRR